MTNKAWLNRDHQLPPGEEIFRSERGFQLYAYSTSHGQLLFRSFGSKDWSGDLPETTIEVLFKPAIVMKIRDAYRGLLIRRAPDDEAERIKATHPGVEFHTSDRVFLMESQGETGYIISMAVGWHEDVLRPASPSFFANVSAEDTRWPTMPLHGVNAGFTIASAADLVEALRRSEGHRRVRRERYRNVYVVMTRVDLGDGPEISGSGVFLTQEDAEDAKAALDPHVIDCWIETLPVAI